MKSIISDNQKLVFLIDAQNGQGKIQGSGFLYNDKGDVITNAHVVDGASTVTVKTADSASMKGTVIGISTHTDVALIRVPELAGKTPVAILKGKQVAIGDGVIALGSPLGLQNSATTGIISGLNRNFKIEKYTYDNVYQISAPISPGNSGGPLLDDKTGQVIGINSAKVGEEAIGFSIAIDQVIALVEGWVNNPSVPAVNNSMSSEESKVAPSTPILTVNMAETLVRSFYDSIDSRDYVAAYSLVGSDWQSKTSYENFRQGYINTFSVRITSLTAGSTGLKFAPHVCVFQTVRDLLANGYQIFVVGDAVCSRTKENYLNGLSLMSSMGAVITHVLRIVPLPLAIM